MRSGEMCVMNPVQHSVSNNTGGAGTVVHLAVMAGDVKTMVEDPEKVMEEIWMRATQVSSVLENILQEPHGVPRWGLNE